MSNILNASQLIYPPQRADVPTTLSPSAPSTSLDISSWGPPTASYLANTCNISEFFTSQQLVLNIDLCVSDQNALIVINTVLT